MKLSYKHIFKSTILRLRSNRNILSVGYVFIVGLIVFGGLILLSDNVQADPGGPAPNDAQQRLIDKNKKQDEEAFKPEIPLPGVFEGLQKADDTLLPRYIRAIYIYFVWVVGIIATVMVIYGGIKWVAAAGNPGQIKDARDIIDNAIIGVIIALVSIVMLNIINPKLTNLQLPTLAQIKKENVCLVKTAYTDFNVCQGSDWLPCGEKKDKTGKDPKSGNNFNYTCYGTFCKPESGVHSLCLFYDNTAYGYGTPTCVTAVPAETTNAKCDVEGTQDIPVIAPTQEQSYTFTGVIQTGGSFGTEFTKNYCRNVALAGASAGAVQIVDVGFIVGKPRAQVMAPVPGNSDGPTSHSRLNGRGCPEWKEDIKMSDLLLP